jgi:hypothetical protein
MDPGLSCKEGLEKQFVLPALQMNYVVYGFFHGKYVPGHINGEHLQVNDFPPSAKI